MLKKFTLLTGTFIFISQLTAMNQAEKSVKRTKTESIMASFNCQQLIHYFEEKEQTHSLPAFLEAVCASYEDAAAALPFLELLIARTHAYHDRAGAVSYHTLIGFLEFCLSRCFQKYAFDQAASLEHNRAVFKHAREAQCPLMRQVDALIKVLMEDAHWQDKANEQPLTLACRYRYPFTVVCMLCILEESDILHAMRQLIAEKQEYALWLLSRKEGEWQKLFNHLPRHELATVAFWAETFDCNQFLTAWRKEWGLTEKRDGAEGLEFWRRIGGESKKSKELLRIILRGLKLGLEGIERKKMPLIAYYDEYCDRTYHFSLSEFAAVMGYCELFEFILINENSPNVCLAKAFEIACRQDQLPIVKLLFEKASIYSINNSTFWALGKRGDKALVELVFNKFIQRNISFFGTILNAASFSGRSELVNFLVTKIDEVAAEPELKACLLFDALRHAQVNGSQNIAIEVLLTSGAMEPRCSKAYETWCDPIPCICQQSPGGTVVKLF